MRHTKAGVFRGSGYANAIAPLLSVGVTYRTATDAVSRRRHLDGGPSPFRAPRHASDEATEEPRDTQAPAPLDAPPPALPPVRHDAERGRRTADRYDIPLEPPTRAGRRRAAAAAASAARTAHSVTRILSPERRVAQARANSRAWLRILATIAGIALLATCAAGTFFLLRDGTRTPNGPESAVEAVPAPAAPDPLDSRATDPGPLTTGELFAATGVAAAGGTYQVVRSEALDRCATAATGGLAELLAQRLCTQVVRGTLISPDGAYAMTAGVANLLDAEGAQAVRAGIEKDAGDFTTLPGGGPTSVLGQKTTVLGYNTYGHYLLYVVIAPTGHRATDQADPAYQAIVGDIVEGHLAQALRPRRG